jgi:outer membrane protein assembly factor BamA
MRAKRTVFVLVLAAAAVCVLNPVSARGDDGDRIALERIRIDGNSVTATDYIRSCVTLSEGMTYDLDTLMDEINISRENLERTGLFTEVFFNDEFDENDNLLLTVSVKEKNYFFFGLGGNTGVEAGDFYFRNSLYVAYKNLFGNRTFLFVELPFYEDQGLQFSVRGDIKRMRYTLDLEYEHSSKTGADSVRFSPGLGYALNPMFFLGADILVNNAMYNSFGLYPFIEAGSTDRKNNDSRSWYFFRLSPYYSHNFAGGSGLVPETDSFYGINAKFRYYRDLLLKIVYQLKIDAALQGGTVPHNLMLESDVRGTRFDAHNGDKKLSLTNEVHVPLPWEESVVIVPFVDFNVIGYSEVEVLLGGGIGVHWFTRFNDPLVFEIAFGRGVMLNFQKRL